MRITSLARTPHVDQEVEAAAVRHRKLLVRPCCWNGTVKAEHKLDAQSSEIKKIFEVWEYYA